MNISSNVLYGGAFAVGALASGIVATRMMAGEDDRRAAYEASLANMSHSELLEAARNGEADPPPSHIWAAMLGVGTATALLGGTGIAAGGLMNALQAAGNAIGGGSGGYLSLRPASTVASLGFGAATGALLAAGAHAILDRD